MTKELEGISSMWIMLSDVQNMRSFTTPVRRPDMPIAFTQEVK